MIFLGALHFQVGFESFYRLFDTVRDEHALQEAILLHFETKYFIFASYEEDGALLVSASIAVEFRDLVHQGLVIPVHIDFRRPRNFIWLIHFPDLDELLVAKSVLAIVQDDYIVLCYQFLQIGKRLLELIQKSNAPNLPSFGPSHDVKFFNRLFGAVLELDKSNHVFLLPGVDL